MNAIFTEHRLDAERSIWAGRLPVHLLFSREQFGDLWSIHPSQRHEIVIHGKKVPTPRWSQAYGADYYYSGTVNKAMPVPILLSPVLAWAQEAIEPSLNGLLLNWYDGQLGDYIGKHRDDVRHLLPNTPIVTVSYGEERIFRLRPWRGTGYRDFAASDGAVFVMPLETNETWTHEVPTFARYGGQRVSVTIRSFRRDGFSEVVQDTRT
jgi:alkylated DNA repair dioxygenase AlkB